MTSRAFGGLLCAILCGCSSSDFETGSPSGDATPDSIVSSDTGTTTDSTTDSGSSVDSGTATDTDATDTGTTKSDAASDTVPEGDTGTCAPFWCGCGTCDPTQIVCTKSTSSCPLGCPASPCAPAEDPTFCQTVGDRCVRTATVMGDVPCYHTADCAPGFCCKNAGTPPSHGTCVTAPSPYCGP